jgi:hypothetical protein
MKVTSSTAELVAQPRRLVPIRNLETRKVWVEMMVAAEFQEARSKRSHII